MAFDPKTYYDGYWAQRDRARTEARSRERASMTLALLSEGGILSGNILDVGCGPGWTLEAFKAAGYAPIGVDAAGVAVAEARSRGLEAHRIDFEREDLSTVLGMSSRYDGIVALEVLEHLADPLCVLESFKTLLSPGGVIVASLPNEITLGARLQILCGRLPFGGHRDPHLRHFDLRQASRLFEAAGLQKVSRRPISLFPPRWKLLRWLTRPLLRMAPGLFALATVHLLTPKGRPDPDAPSKHPS